MAEQRKHERAKVRVGLGTTVALVLGLIAVGGGAAQFMYNHGRAVSEGVIEQLREERDRLKDEKGDLNDANVRLTRENASLRAQIGAVTPRNPPPCGLRGQILSLCGNKPWAGGPSLENLTLRVEQVHFDVPQVTIFSNKLAGGAVIINQGSSAHIGVVNGRVRLITVDSIESGSPSVVRINVADLMN